VFPEDHRTSFAESPGNGTFRAVACRSVITEGLSTKPTLGLLGIRDAGKVGD
jgi:hypothetical protein